MSKKVIRYLTDSGQLFNTRIAADVVENGGDLAALLVMDMKHLFKKSVTNVDIQTAIQQMRNQLGAANHLLSRDFINGVLE
jgi:hypothetical protein